MITDRLSSREWLAWFLDRYSVQPDTPWPPPIDDLAVLRRDLRRILGKWSTQAPLSTRELRTLDRRTRDAPLRQRVVGAGAGPELQQEPLRRDWPWVIATVVASAVELMGTGDPKRLKSCGNPDCSWTFYDTTINRSKRYCSTTPCGSLMRVRRFRQHG